ncbi:hypothetical protein [Bacillus paralicheniformis]|uniref:hypothetical protein n=1 Tax=Bacillus paralicheniformis TaxID=1648923 RepID=UPI00119FA850|nr:hypothetical protein [Bacillus paralicheniformis]
MARNKVEVHIPDGSNFSFKVKAGETLKIGDWVEVSGDYEVAPASGGSQKVIGMVYSGTIGIDGVNVGYQGDNGDVVTVVIAKPIVYATVTDSAPVTAGDYLRVTSAKRVTTLDPATDTFDKAVAIALTSGGTGQDITVALV